MRIGNLQNMQAKSCLDFSDFQNVPDDNDLPDVPDDDDLPDVPDDENELYLLYESATSNQSFH